MLNGKELGQAIEQAIRLKIESGAVKSKAAIARHFGVSSPAIYEWITRGTIKKDKLSELWRYFSDVVGPEHWGMTSEQMPSLDNVTQAQKTKISSVPLISWVTAGELCGVQSLSQQFEADEWIPTLGNHSASTYALRVVGESMIPDYPDGCIIIVDPEIGAQHGNDVVAATEEGKTTFKRLHMTEEGTYLQALNPDWPERIIRMPADSCVCGVVIWMMMNRRNTK